MVNLVEIGPVVLEKKIFEFHQCIFRYFVIISLGKERAHSFEQTRIPFTQGCFVECLVEIGQVVLEKKMKMLKVYRQTDGQTDGPTNGQTTDARQSEMLT